MNELSKLFIIVGLIFNFFGTLGLLRMPDIYSRIQGAFKCVLLGTCAILLGVFLKTGLCATGFKIMVLMIFLLLTVPVCAYVLMKAAHRSGIPLWDGSLCDKYAQDQDDASRRKTKPGV